MNLNAPKIRTFWIAVAIAALSIVVYILHLIFRIISYLGTGGYILMLIAFVLLCLGLTIKDL